jgi:dTMP kinase
LRIVALVGIDGAGKTTQARELAAWLTTHGVPADYWQNAGGRRWFGRLAQRLGRRDAEELLGRQGLLTVEAVLRWLAIARALLRSRLRGRVAVMDRYSYCQYASIRAHRGRGERFARLLYGLFPRPDVVCYLAVPPALAQERVRRRGTDDEELGFLVAFDAGYRSLPEAARLTVLDAAGTPAQVQAALRAVLAPRLPAALAPTAPAVLPVAAPARTPALPHPRS